MTPTEMQQFIELAQKLKDHLDNTNQGFQYELVINEIGCVDLDGKVHDRNWSGCWCNDIIGIDSLPEKIDNMVFDSTDTYI